MLVVISPAKRLDWSEVPDVAPTAPAFAAEAWSLVGTARRLSGPKLQALMSISPELARLNKARFAAFSEVPEAEAVRPAAYAFAGDTYLGLDYRSLDPEARAYAQDHLRILSGLYGLLRPHDAIQPYRLEMGSRLRTRRGPNLYAFWRDRPARALRDAAEAAGTGVLVNCASQEYFGAVDLGALGLRVITPTFLEEGPDGPRQVSFFAKKARGAMARFVVERRLSDPASLAEFDTGGYRLDPVRSAPDAPVFVRRAEAQSAA